MELPLVTVGIASFNNAEYLYETLESVRLQTYSPIEVIIVDDASLDNSAEVAKKWMCDYPDIRAQLIRHEKNQGICRVCNSIITRAKGDFISLIGSDDVYLPDKLANQVPMLMQGPPELGVVFGDIAYMDSQGKSIEPSFEKATMHSGDVLIPLLRGNFVPAMSILVRKKCYDVVGLYDETLFYDDYDMWLRVARKFHFLYVPGITARYRIHPKSVSFSRQLQMLESSLMLVQKHRDHSPMANQLINSVTSQWAATMYRLGGGATARHWLWQSWRQAPNVAGLGFLGLATLRIPASAFRNIKKQVNRLLR